MKNSIESTGPSGLGRGPVLVFGEFGVLNGGEHSFLTVCENLQQRGWQFVAAVPVASLFEAAFANLGITNVGFSTHDGAGVRFSQEALRSQIGQLISDTRPALLHANSLSMSRLCGPVAKQFGMPSLGYLRDILKLSKKAIADINQLDRIVAVSKATANWHVAQGLNRVRVTTIYNGVDGSMFKPKPDNSNASQSTVINSKDEFGIGPTGRCMLYVGQIGMRKGIDTLAEIFLAVAARHPKVHLLIVGERNSTKAEAMEYEQRVRARLEDSKFSDRVHWLGRRSDVANLMTVADILLHPAKQEPLGRVLLEASAACLPIVTTRVGGSAEILPEAASLFEPTDVAGMADYACKLLSDEGLRCRIGAEQQKIADTRFSVTGCADQLERAYRNLLDAVQE